MDFRVWLASAIVVSFLAWFNVGKAPPPKEILLTGDWLFKTGDNANWKDPGSPDSDWTILKVPANWESQGYPGYDGIAWYRKHVQIPAEWRKAAGIVFDMGKTDDEDTTYFNGELIGTHTGWSEYHKYAIPTHLVKYDQDNVVSVRINDTGGNGGMWEGNFKLVTGIMPRYNAADIDKY